MYRASNVSTKPIQVRILSRPTKKNKLMNYIKYLHDKGYMVTKEGDTLNPKGEKIGSIDRQGYIKIAVRINGKRKVVNAHRLQAYQKFGNLIFENGIQVRHKNGIKTDNSYDNILIGTYSDNRNDIPSDIRMKSALKASSCNLKYNKSDVINFYNNNGGSYSKTMIEFGISSKGTLHYILKTKVL